jgi:hypothetical protein
LIGATNRQYRGKHKYDESKSITKKNEIYQLSFMAKNIIGEYNFVK